MDEILNEFINESITLLKQMTQALEVVEADPSILIELEKFGNLVDRLMGGAQTLALSYPPEHSIHLVAKFCQLCKAISYKASQTKNNEQLIQVVTAFLLDSTEKLEEMINALNENALTVQGVVTKMFLDRLDWILKHFDPNLRGSVAINSQSDIDKMLKQLGM